MPKTDNKSSIEQLFRERRGQLYQFLCKRLSNSADAQELVQEAYLRMLRISRQEFVHNPQGYLYRIAYNLVYELYSGAPSLQNHVSDSELVELESSEPQPDDIVDRDNRLAMIASAVQELSPKCRAVILLYWREGLSQREIADRLDLSKTMVQKYLTTGLAYCRKRLNRHTD